MTEFLKGYAAGANDMEAGRLVTTSKPWAARKEVHYFDADGYRIGGDRIVLGPALTAESLGPALAEWYSLDADEAAKDARAIVAKVERLPREL